MEDIVKVDGAKVCPGMSRAEIETSIARDAG
jgi:hypothetical protein